MDKLAGYEVVEQFSKVAKLSHEEQSKCAEARQEGEETEHSKRVSDEDVVSCPHHGEQCWHRRTQRWSTVSRGVPSGDRARRVRALHQGRDEREARECPRPTRRCPRSAAATTTDSYRVCRARWNSKCNTHGTIACRQCGRAAPGNASPGPTGAGARRPPRPRPRCDRCGSYSGRYAESVSFPFTFIKMGGPRPRGGQSWGLQRSARGRGSHPARLADQERRLRSRPCPPMLWSWCWQCSLTSWRSMGSCA